ncbi:golgin subfamily A member 3-like [Mizuhopecten yessoensis]|uniref:Golgin subfamily A member 3 n=1 Tax=Mizuhopecten yessoensis TaxID=6573 RepID=A0A210QA02_MIZYE|nr:golgin subfamily A member 3-like [Mizuhopecten yessoensis]OWF45581.1 Golgin subfamily A member 3 [Mizuhopecten yessoensis]
MEPKFDLNLQQVTFDEGDLSLSNELDSFSNIVHYDSHFSVGGTACISTSARGYTQSNTNKGDRQDNFGSVSRAVAQPSRVKSSQVYCESVCSSHVNQDVHVLINPDDSYITRRSFSKVIPTDIRTLFQVSANTTSIRKKKITKLRKPFIMTDPAAVVTDPTLPIGDSTQAFESVAEALHLQWSVIGDKKLTPASPEVVAQIVAEAEKKLKAQSQGNEDEAAAVFQASMSVSRPVTTPAASLSYQSNISANCTQSPQSAMATNIPNDSLVSQYTSPKEVTSTGETTPNSLMAGSTPSQTSPVGDGICKEETLSVGKTPTRLDVSSSHSMELIQIPAGSITTVTEKMSWFGGGGLAPLSAPIKEKPFPGGRDIYPSGGEDSESEVGSGVGDSVSSATSELDNVIQNDMDSFLKSLPPLKQVDLSMFASKSHVVRSYSPPVKETSFRPLQSTTAASLTFLTSETDGSSLSHHQLSSNEVHPTSPFSDSGLETTPIEFQPSKLLSSTPSKPSLVIPQTGPLFKQLHKMLPKRPKATTEIKSDDQQLDLVLREKAKLEGQLEMLSEEANLTRQERAELQAKLTSLKLQLESNCQSASDAQCKALRTEIEKIQRSKHLLEQSLGSAHKFLEEKNSEFVIQQEELRLSQEINDKLQIRMKEVRDDLRAKEMTIQALKNKIAELYVEVQTALQAKMESENDSRTSRNDLVALINTKDWYQQQLKAAQVARTTLQHELTTLQAQVTSQSSIIERLRTENTKLRQQTKDIQQKALKDKEMLAKHLEHIESDMMHREAAFQEIQRERVLMEDTFDTKLQSVEQERSRAQTLMNMTSELEKYLDKAQCDLKKKQSQILTLESEQIDLMKKLALSQECVIERDLAVEEMQQKLIEVESSLKGFKLSLSERESEIWKLKEEKAAVEISLQAAREEKQSVDNALTCLKDNMGKVEKNFRHMKQELGNRTSEYNEQEKEATALQEELNIIRENLEKEQKSNHAVDREKKEHQQVVDEMRTHKVHLEEEVKFLHTELEALKGSGVEKEKMVECLEAELFRSKQKLSQIEQKLREDKPSPALEELQNENADLKSMLKKSDKQHQKDLTKQKAKVAKLNVDLKSLQSELAQRQSVFESNIELLTGKLREMSMEKEQMETELSMAHRKYDLSMLQQQDQLKTELQCIAAELQNTKLQKQALENDLAELQRVKESEVQEYSQQLSALEAEITYVQEFQVDRECLERNNQNMSLDLEKEKGRVAGLMLTNTALKEHISQLEDALAGRESALIDLQALTRGEVKDREIRAAEHGRLVQELEKKLMQEKESQRELRKQIGTKISENKKLKRHLDSVKVDRDSILQDFDHRSNELKNLCSELDNSKQLQDVQNSQIGTLTAENKSLAHQLERVKQELTDNLTREPIIQEQMSSLQWQLEQKCHEVEALMGQRSFSERRQSMEIDDLQKTVQNQQAELENLREELAVVRQERSVSQTEMSQLRATLKASIQHHKLTQKLNENTAEDYGGGLRDTGTQVESQDLPLIPPLPFDLDIVEKLLQDSTVKALESKPLDNLQTCLSSLRSEITGLQKQMDDHINTIETSTQSWSSVEDQVKELQRIVKTINDTNMMTNSQGMNSLAGAGVIEI